MTTPARVLIDTSVIIELDRIDLGEWVSARPSVSAVSVAELAYALGTTDPVERNARVERYHTALRRIDVLPFDTAAAKLYGVLAALIRETDRRAIPRRVNLQIAATAASRSLPLLTRNPKDFVGLHRVIRVVTI
ncbi:PIN domain-containing protein [Actinoalloteichus hymeniacidonis]|uniref:Nucleic acid-binding protein, contains PIN domain n=1 Tax=Actinoalloteichus hymeniacidonis TaxID=340345 RepID=A0AAC9HMQ1_9PSEU|nr:PIN domain-containing protein [Actinoalloteichus hymeniacidonis]AOS62093.1 putative nucleic acid-binding protein, contains PIN domain [Actinoalloteichus hymeniacidonis]MBB5909885.1 hypothetical protein [Actinoalloteichus hymeniacidonis]